MPDVPRVPGVPPLSSYGTFAGGLLVADALAAFQALVGPQWGLFLNGLPAIAADNVMAFDFRQDFAIADYPLEGGAFESYDKVQLPFLIRLRYTRGGSSRDRQAFIDSVDEAINSMELYDVLTPEKVYASVNPTHQDYRRTAVNGVGLMAIDVWCLQLRVSAQQQFTNTASPVVSAPQNTGTVQPIPTSPIIRSDLPPVQ